MSGGITNLLFPCCVSKQTDLVQPKDNLYTSVFAHTITSVATAIILGIGVALAVYFLTTNAVEWSVFSGIATTITTGLTIYVALRCTLGQKKEEKQVSIDQSNTPESFRKGLKDWVNQASGEEKKKRQEAMDDIMERPDFISVKNVTTLPKGIYQRLTATGILLEHCNLASLDFAKLAQLPLRSVVLRHNQLTSLPKEIAQLTNLEYLSLYDNQLNSGLPELAPLTHLRDLDLGRNGLISCPKEISQLKNLRNLYLWDNQLTSLPPEIAQLSKLKSLILSDNQLTELPKAIGQLANLEKLNLSNNQLSFLPEEITQLKNLKELDLSNNPIQYLCETIHRLPSTTKILITRNSCSSEFIANLENSIHDPNYSGPHIHIF